MMIFRGKSFKCHPLFLILNIFCFTCMYSFLHENQKILSRFLLRPGLNLLYPRNQSWTLPNNLICFKEKITIIFKKSLLFSSNYRPDPLNSWNLLCNDRLSRVTNRKMLTREIRSQFVPVVDHGAQPLPGMLTERPPRRRSPELQIWGLQRWVGGASGCASASPRSCCGAPGARL